MFELSVTRCLFFNSLCFAQVAYHGTAAEFQT